MRTELVASYRLTLLSAVNKGPEVDEVEDPRSRVEKLLKSAGLLDAIKKDVPTVAAELAISFKRWMGR